ncbi:signal peptidase I [Abyssalbus ytuae]|uniref:Signal peptidase I n=1 Tax=Abyssalbus ytuae TaxID=2926907 RepID=A0A9E7CYR5_9FLAO|nr:signal peptidase I [Abyssalbus ytuae]UOB16915.1 signal peptidase I [Abyssalbus ytuae]
MTISQWFIFFLILQVIHFAGTWKLYVKAGRKAWEAAVPVYNAVVLMKIINRPWWWVILLFIPIINLIMIPVVWVETIRSFGRNTTTDTVLVLVTLGFYIYYVNYMLDVNYIEDRDLKPRTATGEWVSSILFAIVAATLVHTYFIQPYVIPTSSLEKTLLVGDFLFVSKFHYGARTPMTTIAAPMVHDTLPVVKTKSYLKKPQLPYFRLPGFQNIKRNDIVVFSWPVDTVEQFFVKTDRKIRKPIDKKSNYVKRCVGIPGDTLRIINGYVHINGKKTVLPDRAKPQFFYTVTTKNPVDRQLAAKYNLKEFRAVYGVPANYWDDPKVQNYLNGKMRLLHEVSRDSATVNAAGFISRDAMNRLKISQVNNKININLTEEQAEKLRKDSNVISVEKFNYSPDKDVFPHSPLYNWSIDNFGPIYIPEESKTINLNVKNLPLYKRIITEYEGNTLQVKGNQVIINGQVANTYTFKQNYYWMMGDNRHNSEDARIWGYVPEDHIVGKPVFIWMSIDGINDGIKNWKVRWDRVFTTVGGSGEPVSYFKYFLILIAIWIGYSQFKKYKKKKA